MTELSKDGRRLRAFGLLAVSALLVAAVRLRLADLPLERDEGEYAYFAQLLLQGIPPYAAAYTMKLPGTSAVYAAAMALLGQSAFAIRIGLLVVSLATMAGIYALGRRLADEWTGAVAGAAYGLMALSVPVLGFAAHATHFVALCAVGGLVLLLRAIDSGRTSLFFASGAVLGLAYTMKQHGIVFAAFGVFWLLCSRATLRRVAEFSAGAALPFVLVSLALYFAGVFERFWFWNFTYASTYATSEPLSYGVDRLRYALRNLQPLAGFGALASLGLLAPIWDASARRSVLFFGSLLFFSLLAVVPGFQFRHHYFIAIWPALALLVGVGVTALARRLNWTAAAALLVAAAALVLAVDRDAYFRLSPLEFSRAVYYSNPFPESIEIAEYVKANTKPDDRIAVIGSEPQIYFYSGRHSASGHIYMYGLVENQPHSLEMQKEFAAEVEAARPPIVILINIFTSWLTAPGSADYVFTWAESFLKTHYDPVGLVDIIDGGTVTTWGDEVRSIAPRSENFIAVFRRKDPDPG